MIFGILAEVMAVGVLQPQAEQLVLPPRSQGSAAFYRYEVGAFLHHLGMTTTPGDKK